MKKYLLILLSTFISAAIRIGAEVETGGVSFVNPDYLKTSSLKNSYNYQKSRLYLEGDLKKNVTVGVKLLSRGIFGKEFGKEYTTATCYTKIKKFQKVLFYLIGFIYFVKYKK